MIKHFRQKRFEKKSAFTPSYSGRQKSAFTLPEVMIALVVLGIIAAITVSTLMRKSSEVSDRTKVKKSIADYEKVVENMRITQGLKSVKNENDATDTTTLVGWANNDGKCTNGRTYFKINKEYSANQQNCKFQTNDGVLWDISDMSQAKISIDKDGSCLASVGAAEGEDCYNKSFYVTVEDGPGNSFLVNEPNGSAKAALVFAKILNEDTNNGAMDKFAACRKVGDGETCYVDGQPYTREVVPEDVSICKDGYGIALPYGCSITKAGEYFVTKMPAATLEEATSAENCTTSTFSKCSTDGDYWNAAKRICEARGETLVSASDVSSLTTKSGYYWLSNPKSNDYQYFADGWFNFEGPNTRDKSHSEFQVYCITQ